GVLYKRCLRVIFPAMRSLKRVRIGVRRFVFAPSNIIILYLALTAAVALAQSYRGEAVAVVQRAEPLEFSRMRFLAFAFGREGPMDTPLSTPPVMGRE